MQELIITGNTAKSTIVAAVADFDPKTVQECAQLLLLCSVFGGNSEQIKEAKNKAYILLNKLNPGEQISVNGLKLCPSFKTVKTEKVIENKHSKKIKKEIKKLESEIDAHRKTCAEAIKDKLIQLESKKLALKAYTQVTEEKLPIPKFYTVR